MLTALQLPLKGQSQPDSLIIKNFSSTNYLASSVNYTGLSLPDNTLLFANDRGLLTYDGTEWRLFPIKNDSKVISLLYGDSLIYVGGDDEFGYFERKGTNEFEYFSLREKVSDSLELSSFFQVISLNKDIYFQSYEGVFKWDGDSVQSVPISNAHIFNVQDKIIVSSYSEGLYGFNPDNSTFHINSSFKFETDAAFSILKTSQPNKYIVFTSDSGAYLLNTKNYSVSDWDTEASELFRRDGFYLGTYWLDSLYAATTWDGSVVIFNENGDVKNYIDKSKGITGKYLRELFIDNRNKIWVTSDVGLSEVYYPKFDTLREVFPRIARLSINDKSFATEVILDTLISENSNLKFSFVTPGFETDEILYSYKLDGLTNKWSQWNEVSSKEYTQLKGGTYTLNLKAKTNTGLVSKIVSYSFKILTPWYKTSWAYVLYTLIFIGIIALITWSRNLRLKILNNRLERIITSRTKEITEKSQALEIANETLKIKNQELDNFVYRSSHDLIAPLKSLKGLIHIAKSDNTDDIQLEYLKHMEKSVLKLEDFIKSILEFATNIKTTTQKVDVDLNEIIDDIAYELRYYENAKDIKLKKQLEVSHLNTEPKRLKIILSNLLTNAVKYHNYDQENPYVEVRAHENGNGETIIEIIDNGQGIKKEHVSNIFDMFFRANNSSDGSGLGLYIVKDMVERIDGTINVSSTFGKGTSFTLIFNENGTH